MICIPKLALEIQDLSLPATVLLPRLDDRQHQTDRSNKHEHDKHVDYDYKVGDKILIRKDGILRKADSILKKEPWTITTVHTNGTIRFQCETKSERINIRRVTP